MRERLQFDHFDAQTAWEIGSQLRQVAEERQLGIVIDIQLHGLPLCAPRDNPEWVRRKRNIVRRFFRSSYAIGLMVKSAKLNLDALDACDYAHHGGSFPILLRRTGCVGTITVSGLPQREDHSLVVEIVAKYLQKDISDLSLLPKYRSRINLKSIVAAAPLGRRGDTCFFLPCRYPYQLLAGKFPQA